MKSNINIIIIMHLKVSSDTLHQQQISLPAEPKDFSMLFQISFDFKYEPTTMCLE